MMHSDIVFYYFNSEQNSVMEYLGNRTWSEKLEISGYIDDLQMIMLEDGYFD